MQVHHGTVVGRSTVTVTPLSTVISLLQGAGFTKMRGRRLALPARWKINVPTTYKCRKSRSAGGGMHLSYKLGRGTSLEVEMNACQARAVLHVGLVSKAAAEAATEAAAAVMDGLLGKRLRRITYPCAWQRDGWREALRLFRSIERIASGWVLTGDDGHLALTSKSLDTKVTLGIRDDQHGVFITDSHTDQ